MGSRQRIKIRPYLFPDMPEMGPKLSIEIDGRIMPLADAVELQGIVIATDRNDVQILERTEPSNSSQRRGKPLFG